MRKIAIAIIIFLKNLHFKNVSISLKGYSDKPSTLCDEHKKNEISLYTDNEEGYRLFRKALEKSVLDKDICPLHISCSVYFAKWHDKHYPSFFENPCWEIRSCDCPIKKKEGCDTCVRKKDNLPLC